MIQGLTAEETTLAPKLGVGVIVLKEGKFLLGKRKGAHGEGMWAPPGGHLEWGESFETCAKRELFEETGLTALSLREGPCTNDLIDGKNYITIFMFVDQFEGNLQVLEPHKCENWQWFDWNDPLPSPLFPTVCSLFTKTGAGNPELKGLLAKIHAFFNVRDWEQFHSPKNMVMDLAAEVGELVDPFRWLTEEESYHLNHKQLAEVKDEIGDVFKIILYLSDKLGIDPIQATLDKLEKMEQKYPADASKGKAQKYTAYHKM